MSSELDPIVAAEAISTLADGLSMSRQADYQGVRFSGIEQAFDAKYPYAPPQQREQFLISEVQRLAREDAANLQALDKSFREVEPVLAAQVERAKLAPNEADKLRENFRTTMTATMDIAAKTLDVLRETQIETRLGRCSLDEAIALYDAAFADGDTPALRVLEAHAKQGWPTIGRRGDKAEAVARHAALLKRIDANQDARIPPGLKAAWQKLQTARQTLSKWQAMAATSHAAPTTTTLRGWAADARARLERGSK